MARVVRRTPGRVVRVIAVREVPAMMVLVAPRTRVREVRDMTVLVALRMMAPEGRHIQGPVVHAMRVPVVRAIRAQGGRAEDVHRFASDGARFSAAGT